MLRLVVVVALALLLSLVYVAYAEPFFMHHKIVDFQVAFPSTIPAGLPVDIYVYARLSEPPLKTRTVAVYLECTGPAHVVKVGTLTFDIVGEALARLEVEFPKPGTYLCTVQVGPRKGTVTLVVADTADALLLWLLNRPHVLLTGFILLVLAYAACRFALPKLLPLMVHAFAALGRRGSLAIPIALPRFRRRTKIVEIEV